MNLFWSIIVTLLAMPMVFGQGQPRRNITFNYTGSFVAVIPSSIKSGKPYALALHLVSGTGVTIKVDILDAQRMNQTVTGKILRGISAGEDKNLIFWTVKLNTGLHL